MLTAADSLLLDSIGIIIKGENPKPNLDAFIGRLKKRLPEQHPVLAEAIYKRGILDYRSSNYYKTISFYTDAVWRYEKNNSPADFNTICKLYRNISLNYYFVEGYLDSVYYYADLGLQKMNEYPDSLIDDNIRIGLYQWAGLASREMGDLAASGNFLKMGVDLCKQGRSGYKICGPTTMNYAWTLWDQNQLDSAMHYSLLAEQFFLDQIAGLNAWDSTYIADIYNNRSEILTLSKDHQAAIQAQHNSLIINQKIRPNSRFVAMNYNNIGYAYVHEQKLDSAESYLMRSMQINQALKDTFLLAQNLENLADVCLYKGRHFQALEFLDQAINFYFPNPKNLPTIAALYKYEMILPMSQRARTLYTLHQNDSQSYPLERVLKAYEQVDSLVSALQFSVRSEQSKVLAVEKLKPVYEDLIGICEMGWRTRKDTVLLAKAFRYLERSKALVLRERQQNAQLAAMINQERFQQRERQFIGDINRLNLKLQKGQLTKTESHQLLDQIQRKELSLKSYRDSLYQNAPKYKGYLSDTDIEISKKIRQSLTEKQIVLDYFVGDHAVFVGTLTAEGLGIQKLPVSPEQLADRVTQFRSAINISGTSMNLSLPERLAQDSVYRTNGLWLYKQLIEPLAIPASISRLTIIPDGILAFLPFSALLTQQQDLPEAYASYAYLVKDKVINHQFSLAIWYDNLQRTYPPNKGILAIAPTQTTGKSLSHSGKKPINFSSLRYNQEEIKPLDNNYGAKTLTGREASREMFEQLSGDYQILHFAGHAYADLENAYHSFLAFDIDHSSVVSDELFLLDQLEKLPLKANMVVLSACQTADGDLAKGEGVISLSRAATLAGAKSVVSSLWLVNQQSKVGLFQDFYAYLAQGLPKDEALQLAQLNYMQQEINNPHPYYWAGLINMGDSEPVALSKPSLWAKLFSRN
ncbi:MAG: hypothetical protein DHS20C18_48620 [Saprospiraceae bacterium]|nr:MAG: hypothetical protein DHS20C18_48620 [Saprospiraceae bacterium]